MLRIPSRSIPLLLFLTPLLLFTFTPRARADEICTVTEDVTVVKISELQRYLAFLFAKDIEVQRQANNSVECTAKKGNVVLVKDYPYDPSTLYIHVEVQEKRSFVEKWVLQLVPYCDGWALRYAISCPSWRTSKKP